MINATVFNEAQCCQPRDQRVAYGETEYVFYSAENEYVFYSAPSCTAHTCMDMHMHEHAIQAHINSNPLNYYVRLRLH